MKTSNWAIAAACAAVFSTTAVAGPNDIALSHYDSLQQLDMRTVSADAANAVQQADIAAPFVMSFDALGQRFDVELEANSRLMSVAHQNPSLAGVQIFRGELVGRPDSWARIVVADGMPQGMIWDGQDMYAIEAPGDSIVDTDTPVIYRLADVQVAPGSMTCGSMPFATSGAAAYDGLVAELSNISQGPGAIEEIELGAIGDFEFTSSKGGDSGAATAITNRLNIVDGIFSQQLGVQITVTTIETFSSSNDPFTESEAGLLLDEVSDYRSITPAQNSNGLTHLYTGRDLDGQTVGVAWTAGALCSNYFGAGLSEGNGSAAFDSLVAAHEIGHNFGAPHDGESGSACESESGSFLMAPTLNGSDQFSSCSLNIMSQEAASAICITPLPSIDMAVGIEGSPSVLFGASSTVTYDIDNNGSLDATNVVADFTLPANVALDSATASQGTCTSGAGTVSCAIGTVPGFANRTVDLTVTPASIGVGTITASVTSDVDDRPGNNLEQLQFSVDPAVDLVVNVPTGSDIKLDQSTTITATLENRATIDATGVTMIIDLGNALNATAANWSIGSCTVQSTQRVSCQAATFAANSSSTVSVTATGVTAGNPNINISLSSVEAELVVNNNSANGRLEVKDKNEDSGSGSTGPLFLLLMAVAGLLRRRR